MYSYSKTFFSRKRAEYFAERLELVGIEDVVITAAKDGFGQTQYRVQWNEPDED